MSLTHELETACRAARAGGAAAMQFYGGELEASMKAGRSPVTAADHASNAVITAHLASEFPDDAILSEETRDSTSRLSASRLWIVDPLDGTKEFLARNGEFSIMIGLAILGEAVLGVVYRPVGDVLYAAARGAGAWLEIDRFRRPLRSRRRAEAGSIRLVGSRSHPDPLQATMQEALRILDVRACGSVGLKCGLIAEGECDLYVHPVPFMSEWDTCAPEVILSEAGGRVTDCLGEPLRYNKPDPSQPEGILAVAGGIDDGHVRAVIELYSSSRCGAAAGAEA